LAGVSITPINAISIQITKSVNTETGDKKGADTLGLKHREDVGLYIYYGSNNKQLEETKKYRRAASVKIKKAIVSLCENDVSSARPDGSMEVNNVYWWEHRTKMGQYSSAKVHRSLEVTQNIEEPKSIDDFTITLHQLDGLQVEEI